MMPASCESGEWLSLALILAAQAILAPPQAAEPVGRHEWIEVRVTSLEIGESLLSSIVLPNGQKAVPAPRAPASNWLALRAILRTTSEDPARPPVVLENVFVVDGQGASHRSRFPRTSRTDAALKETTAVFTFEVTGG